MWEFFEPSHCPIEFDKLSTFELINLVQKPVRTKPGYPYWNWVLVSKINMICHTFNSVIPSWHKSGSDSDDRFSSKLESGRLDRTNKYYFNRLSHASLTRSKPLPTIIITIINEPIYFISHKLLAGKLKTVRTSQ